MPVSKGHDQTKGRVQQMGNRKGHDHPNAVVCILISFLTLYHDDVVAKRRLGLANLGATSAACLQSKRDLLELRV